MRVSSRPSHCSDLCVYRKCVCGGVCVRCVSTCVCVGCIKGLCHARKFAPTLLLKPVCVCLCDFVWVCSFVCVWV